MAETTVGQGKTKRQIRVASIRDIVEGQGLEVNADGHRIGIFQIKNKYYAIANHCLHRGGPLSEGELDGFMVTCPWHGWKYDVRTGTFQIIPTLKIKSYRVEQKGDDLYVELD